MSAWLDISNALKFPGQTYAFTAEVEVEDMEVLDDPVSFIGVTLKGEYVGTGKLVGIRGSIEATVKSRCARCLGPVSLPIEAEIDVQYAKEPDPDDPDLYSYDGYKLDLTDAVRDGLLLNLPYRFLCREDCAGLCPRCGHNLNLGPCTCQEGGQVNNPFSALKAFLQNNEEV